MKKILKSLVVGAGLLFACSLPAFAQVSTVTFVNGAPGGGDGTDYTTYNATLDGTPVTTFCVDPFDDITTGDTYTAYIDQYVNNPAGGIVTDGVGDSYYGGGLASALTSSDYYQGGNPPAPATPADAQQVANEVGWLANTYFTDAGIYDQTDYQEAIWNIVDPNYAPADPDANTSTLVTLAEDYASSSVYTDISWIQAPIYENAVGGIPPASHTQEFVYYIPSAPTVPFDGLPPTPEPSFAAFVLSLGIGLGIMAFARRRMLSAR